jgi:DNA polymerase III epsilon subunit-like protein
MFICSIDVETSGLNPKENQLLSIGIVVEDTKNILPLNECPQMHIIIPREEISGNVFALDMNRDLITKIKDYNLKRDGRKEINGVSYFEGDFFVRGGVVAKFIADRLKDYGFKPDPTDGRIHITCLGKNFGTFDKLFLEQLPMFNHYLKIRQRIIDPAVMATNWQEDESLPSLNTCMERVGIKGVVTHNALEDALVTLEVLRKLTENYGTI